MKNLFNFFIFCLLALLTSCADDSSTKNQTETVSYFNDTESKDPWINIDNTIFFQKSHSGNKVSPTDSIANFSLGFTKKLEDITEKKIGYIVMSAWIYSETLSDFKGLTFVATISNSEQNVFWYGDDLSKKITQAGEWVNVYDSIPLTINQKSGDLFTGYIWNTSKTKVLVDDITFRFVPK